MEPGIYLLKVSFCLLVFYFLYHMVFRCITFFVLNRIYLLMGLVLSMVIPILNIPFWNDTHPLLFTTDFSLIFLDPSEHDYDRGVPFSTITESFDYSAILGYLYFTGVAFMSTRFLYSLYKIHCITQSAIPVTDDEFRIFKTDRSQPFTFLNHIFLPHYEVDTGIIAHEKVHARQLHSIDILLAEVFNLFLWFNPLMLLYKKAIKEQHEYLADAHALKNFLHVEQYLAVMLSQIQRENQINILSGFYSKSIKNRITMITKNRTSLKFTTVYLALIPVCSILLFAFANKTSHPAPDTQTSISEPIVIVDAGHGGSDHGTLSSDGAMEKSLTLAMAKQIQKMGANQGLKIILTRAEDVTLPLDQRAMAAEKVDGKLFISLHFNSNEDISKSGIECVVSENNIAFEQSTAFGNLILNEFTQLKGIGVNGIKKSNAYVLKNNSIPAVVLELGYLSNKADNAFLSKEKNQELLSEKIVSSMIKYLN